MNANAHKFLSFVQSPKTLGLMDKKESESSVILTD